MLEMLQITLYAPYFIVPIWEPLHNAHDGLTDLGPNLRYFVPDPH